MIKQKLTLPTDQLWRYSAIIAKQGDNKARYFSVTMTVNGRAIALTEEDEVRINITRSDGSAQAYAGKVEDGKAILPLPLWATEIADSTIQCDVSATIANADGEGNSGTISTATFNVYIQSSNCSDENVAEDDSYTVLEQLILQVKVLETAAANETARVEAENARVEAENKRVTAESTRITNETTREENETTRQANEESRATAETNRVTEFNNIKSTAETLLDDLTGAEANAATSAESAASSATAAANSLSELETQYNAMNVTLYVDTNGDLHIVQSKS